MSGNVAKNISEQKWVSKASLIGGIAGAIVGGALGQLFLGDAIGLGPIAFLPAAVIFGMGGFMGASLLD